MTATATSKPETYSAALVLDELLVLDGRCTAEVQAIIDAAKADASRAMELQLTDKQSRMLGLVLARAAVLKRVPWSRRRANTCPLCEGRGSAWVRKRRRSRSNPSGSPETGYSGVPCLDFDARFVVIGGHVFVGWCEECHEQTMKAALLAATTGTDWELPKDLTGESPRFKAWRSVLCKCGWSGHEGQMTREMTLMGDGTYPAGCPQCGAKNAFFNHNGPQAVTPEQWVSVALPTPDPRPPQ